MNRTIYLDKDFVCHETPAEGLREVVVEDYLDGVLDVSRLRYVPMGETWIRPDGTVFAGLMVTRVSSE